jgi:hypothetical protein
VKLSREHGGQNFTDQLDSLAMDMQFHTAILTNAWDADGPGQRSDRCEPDSNTVAGRVSDAVLCPDVFQAADATYEIARLAIEQLGAFIESNAEDFHFHDFIDEPWVERVPTTADPVGYPRLQTQ